MLYKNFQIKWANESKPLYTAKKGKTTIKMAYYEADILSQFLIDQCELHEKLPGEVIFDMLKKTYFSENKQANCFAETIYEAGVCEALAKIFEYINAARNMSIRKNAFIVGKTFIMFAEKFSTKKLSEVKRKKAILDLLQDLYNCCEEQLKLYRIRYSEDSEELLFLKRDLGELSEFAEKSPQELALSSIYSMILDNWDTWLDSPISFYDLLALCAEAEGSTGAAKDRACLLNLVNSVDFPII